MSYAAVIVLGMLVALRAAMTFAPSSWLWGVDTLAGASLPTRWAGLSLALLGALAVLPTPAARERPARRGKRKGTGTRSRTWLNPRMLLWTGAGLALLLVVFLPCEHLLLGDGQTYVSGLERGVRVGGAAHREPLPQAVLSTVHALVGGPGIRVFGMTGQLLAVAALLLAALIARRLSADPHTRLVVFSAIALGGGLQLFARYAEYYAFAFTAGLLFLWCALRWLAREGPLVAVTVSYAVAGLCHAVFLFAAPAAFYIAWLAWRRGERRSLLLALLAAPLVGAGLLMLFHYPFGEIVKEASRGSTFLPPLGAWTERTAYSAFAPAHLVELLDLVLLVSPALLVLGVLAVRVRGHWSETERFAALLVPGLLFFVLFAHAELGTVRDWDFYVVPITLVTFAVVVRLATRAHGDGEKARAPGSGDRLPRGLGLALLLTGLVTAGAWMQSNHDPRQARARLERTGENPALYGAMSRGELWRYLSAACLDAGDGAGAVRACVHAIESEPDDRQNYRFLASLRIDQANAAGGDVDAGVQRCVRDLDGRRHSQECLYHGIALAAAMAGRGDLALWAAQKAVDAGPRSAEAAALLGDALRRAARYAEARRAYGSALALNPDIPRARVGLAALAGVAGDSVAVRALAADALKRTPWSPLAQQFKRAIDSGVSGSEAFRDFLYVR